MHESRRHGLGPECERTSGYGHWVCEECGHLVKHVIGVRANTAHGVCGGNFRYKSGDCFLCEGDELLRELADE